MMPRSQPQGRYRIRTWFRIHTPTWLYDRGLRLSKGKEDCGNHEWLNRPDFGGDSIVWRNMESWQSTAFKVPFSPPYIGPYINPHTGQPDPRCVDGIPVWA